MQRNSVLVLTLDELPAPACADSMKPSQPATLATAAQAHEATEYVRRHCHPAWRPAWMPREGGAR